MKKIIIIAGLLLLAAACQKQAQKNQENKNQPQEQASSTVPNNQNLPQGNKTGWETYTNTDYGFTVQYPKSEFLVYTDYNKVKTLSYVPACDKTMAGCLFYSKDNQKGTNFEGAGVSVNVLKNLTTKAKCETMAGAQGVKAEINGETFSRFGNSGAAAGHFEEFQSNRIFKNNTCYEVILRVTSSNIANYPEGTVKEFNNQEVWDNLDQVLNTLKIKQTEKTGDWKIENNTITSQVRGLSFTIPLEFRLALNKEDIISFSSKRGSIGVSIANHQFDKNSIYNIGGLVANPIMVKIGDKEGYEFGNGDGPWYSREIDTALKNQTLRVTFSAYHDSAEPQVPNDEPLINLVLSSFKFGQ